MIPGAAMALLWCWSGLMAVAAVVWLSRHRAITAGRSKLDRLSASPLVAEVSRQTPTDTGLVTVMLAAKDEALNIDTCLESLAAQRGLNLEIITIDDRSGDDTAARIQRWAERDARIRPVRVTELPPGWFGKSHALHVGLQAARGDWLLFTDADCRFLAPDALAAAVRYAAAQDLDFLSIFPRQHYVGFWERVMQPACSAILMIWFNPVKVNDPTDSAVYANGAFMLVRRRCYEAIGGHAAVRDRATEDLRLAERAKRAGFRLRVVGNEDIYEVRMYESFVQIIRGWTRIFAGGLDRLRPLLRALRVLVIFGVMPAVSLVCGLAGGRLSAAPHAPGWNVLAVASAAALLAEWSVMIRFYGMSRCPRWYGLLYPLGAIISAGILLRAMGYVAGWSKLTWRGTAYGGR